MKGILKDDYQKKMVIKKDDYQIFVCAVNQLVDIQSTITTNIRTSDIFSGLVPPLMFLKYAFKDSCWHNDISQGCFIIDDPLLKRKYGFLDYDKLLELME